MKCLCHTLSHYRPSAMQINPNQEAISLRPLHQYSSVRIGNMCTDLVMTWNHAYTTALIRQQCRKISSTCGWVSLPSWVCKHFKPIPYLIGSDSNLVFNHLTKIHEEFKYFTEHFLPNILLTTPVSHSVSDSDSLQNSPIAWCDVKTYSYCDSWRRSTNYT